MSFNYDPFQSGKITQDDFKKKRLPSIKNAVKPPLKRPSVARSPSSEFLKDPLQQTVTEIRNKANTDPRLTETTARQKNPGTRESAMAEYDMRRYGFKTNGDPRYNDKDRQDFLQAVDTHIYGGHDNDGNPVPPSKDGKLPPGQWARMSDVLKSKYGKDVIGSSSSVRGGTPDSGDELRDIATGLAQGAAQGLSLPSQMAGEAVAAPLGEAIGETNPVTNLARGTAQIGSMFASPWSGASALAGAVGEGAVEDGLPGAGKAVFESFVPVSSIKDLFDPSKDWGTRAVGLVSILAAGHGARSLYKGFKSGKEAAMSASQEAKAAGHEDLASTIDEVVQNAPQELEKAWDAHKFTEDLKAQEGPIEVGQPPKFTVRAKAGSRTSEPINNETQPIPNESVKPAKPSPRIKQKSEEPVTPPEATGLANQVQEREALAGVIKEIPSAKGKSAEAWLEEGRKLYDSGADYRAVAREVGDGRSMEPAEVGLLALGKAELLKEVNKARAEVDADPKDTKAQERYRNATEELDSYLSDIQAGKGKASDVFRALQSGVQIDTGDFASVLAEAKRKPHYDPAQDVEIKRLTDEVSKRDAEIEKLKSDPSYFKAKQEINRSSPRKFDKTKIRANIETNRTRLKELVGASGVGSSKTRGAVSITTKDIKVAVDQALIIKDIALDYARLGAANLEDVVLAVQQLFRQDGIEIERQAVIDAIATKGPGKERSEAQKAMDSVRSDARKQSSDASIKSEQREYDRAKKQEATKERASLKSWWGKQSAIIDAKAKLEGSVAIKSRKSPKTVTEEIADLEAERRVWDSRVRAKLRDMESPKSARLIRGTLQTVRGLKLGSDIGVLVRQGLFSMSRPKAYAKGLAEAGKTVFSETNLAKWAKSMDEKRYSDGKSALRARKDSGLSLTDALNSHEELVIGKLAKKVFGEKLGGSLERFQTTFINTVRAEIFDAAYEKGLSPKDLKTRARYINNVTGRGNMKRAPSDLANIFMTSPRYEASRWGTIGEYLRNPVEALQNKGARQNLQDLAVTSATVYTLLQASQLAGYTVSFDPDSSDFLKMRLGKEVWDVTAGLAPRIRDCLRVVAAMKNVTEGDPPGFGKGVGETVGRAVLRTANPAVTTPVSEASVAMQRINGVDVPKGVFSGLGDEGDIHGWEAFAPLIWQSFHQALNEGAGIAPALGVAAKEFVGTGVNFYDSRSKKSKANRISVPRLSTGSMRLKIK